MKQEQGERSERPARQAWLWLAGVAVTAGAIYWALPAGHAQPSSATVFGINAPQARMASYPGLRVQAPLVR